LSRVSLSSPLSVCSLLPLLLRLYFLFHTPSTTEIYTLSLHDALPIYMVTDNDKMEAVLEDPYILITDQKITNIQEVLPVLLEYRSEEHTSELQSRFDLVCRLLLEKKKNRIRRRT